jgi:multicomponent Na+:H+ antiporter subunit E
VLHYAGTFALLFAFWLLLSGHFTAFLLLAGAGCSLAALLFARRMRIVDREGQPLHLGARAPLLYWPWLGLEIVKSGWDVTRRILHPRLPISPTLARFKPSQRTDLGLVIHANSITLTPGTICVETGRGEFLVHALSAEGAGSLEGSEMDRRVSGMESGR